MVGDPQSQPLCVHKYDRKPLVAFVLATVPVYLLGLYYFAGMWYLSAVRIIVFLFVVAIPCYWLVAAVYSKMIDKKIEFYEGYVRLFSVRGQSEDIEYSRLALRWTNDHNKHSLCILSVEGPNSRARWRTRDMTVDELGMTLFSWLKVKTGPSQWS